VTENLTPISPNSRQLCLERTDLWPGKITLDDVGLQHRGLVRTTAIPWDEIHEYALSLELGPAHPDALSLLDVFGEIFVTDVLEGLRGRSAVHASIVVRGDGKQIALTRWYRDAARGTTEILRRVQPRLLDIALAQLGDSGRVDFDRLHIGRDKIARDAQPPVPADQVESVGLFDSSPLTFRIMQRGRALPYVAEPLDRIPNALVALRIAREAGYRVVGL
jgi:hypothetical protein